MATKQLPTVAIVGRANVGKSSLFNRLLGRRQAITDNAAGTTRDAVSGEVSWNGGHFRLIDTAGLETGEAELRDQIGDQIASATLVADLILVAVDGTTILTDQDRLAAKLALKSRKPVILVISKADQFGYQEPAGFDRLGIKERYLVSAIQGQGSGDLLDAVVANLPKLGTASDDSDIKLALIGRPNVGKSSLLNGLAGKQQAVVGSVAGTTRDVRDITLKAHGQSITLLDTAGLRRRGKITAGVEKYSVTRTLSAIEAADICLLVLDATELSVAGDQHLAGLIKDAGKGLIIIVNKWDLIDSEELSQGQVVNRLKRDFAFVPWAPVVFTSAVTGLHLTQLFELAIEIRDRRAAKIATSAFNNWLTKATREHPPAGLKNRQPRINYGTQSGTNPPRFLIFATYADLVHFSYKRYLENGLRETFDFVGTPIELEFRDKRQEKV